MNQKTFYTSIAPVFFERAIIPLMITFMLLLAQEVNHEEGRKNKHTHTQRKDCLDNRLVLLSHLKNDVMNEGLPSVKFLSCFDGKSIDNI